MSEVNRMNGDRYCTKCGAKIFGEARFCGRCGNPLVNIQEEYSKNASDANDVDCGDRVECRVETVTLSRDELGQPGQTQIEINGKTYAVDVPANVENGTLAKVANPEGDLCDANDFPLLIQFKVDEQPAENANAVEQECDSDSQMREEEKTYRNVNPSKIGQSENTGKKKSANTCDWCGAKLNFFSTKYRCKDGCFCENCVSTRFPRNAGNLRNRISSMSKEECEQYAEFLTDLKQQIKEFTPTYSPTTRVHFDDENRKALFKYTDITQSAIIEYDRIVDFELLENGGSIAKGGTGRAFVGGLLFGSTGAIVGSNTRKQKKLCESLKIKLTIKDSESPSYYIDLITSPVDIGSKLYKQTMEEAQNIMSKLQLITSNSEDSTQPTEQTSAPKVEAEHIDPVTEIRRYKELYDDGILTEEEFNQKKKQLLGI